jgi:hypothetical protein
MRFSIFFGGNRWSLQTALYRGSERFHCSVLLVELLTKEFQTRLQGIV